MKSTSDVTAEDLAAFLATPPPRQLPPRIRRRLGGGYRRFLLILGVWFLVLGAFGTWVFFPRRPFDSWAMKGAELRPAVGEVIGSVETSYSPREGSDERYREHRFRFEAADGSLHEGASYDLTERDLGEEVQVEYDESAPRRARIRGGALDPVSPWAIVVVLFPLIGAVSLWWAVRSRRRLKRTLRLGRFESATVESVVATNVSVNNQRRHRITLEVGSGGSRQELVVNAYGAAVDEAEEKQRGGEPLGVILDPARPQEALIAACLLGRGPL